MIKKVFAMFLYCIHQEKYIQGLSYWRKLAKDNVNNSYLEKSLLHNQINILEVQCLCSRSGLFQTTFIYSGAVYICARDLDFSRLQNTFIYRGISDTSKINPVGTNCSTEKNMNETIQISNKENLVWNEMWYAFNGLHNKNGLDHILTGVLLIMNGTGGGGSGWVGEYGGEGITYMAWMHAKT